MMLAYLFPQFMPGAVPFALNGGGLFYMFDMRNPAADSEYPIICCPAGCLDFHDAIVIAESFLSACMGEENIEDLL